MGTQTLTSCRAGCPAQQPPRHGIVARITALVLALGALVLVLSGEHWILAEAPRTADELTLAVCALDDASGAHPAAVCLNPQSTEGRTL
jgi:hypothetical protein